MHYSVMLRESVELLAVRQDGTYLDVTAGMGGHTAAIAALLSTGRVVAADADSESLEIARQNTAQYADRIRFLHTPFSNLRRALSSIGIERVDGLLADLGVSWYQLVEAKDRGFSLSSSGELDMRLDRTQGVTAADLVNFTNERELADLIYREGEERRARRIARAIRRSRPIRDTGHLARVIEEAVPRTGRLHPATLTFMAIRRAVNREGPELDALLAIAPEIVAPGGRIVVIDFMSLEDRKVKESFRALAREGRARLINRHVLTPGQEELAVNPASRSAKLRALEML